MDGIRYRSCNDLLRNENYYTGSLLAYRMYPLHYNVHSCGNVLGNACYCRCCVYGSCSGPRCSASGGSVDGEVHNEIITTVNSTFNLSAWLLIPVIVVIVMILMKKPTLPTFVCGILVGAVIGMISQGTGLVDMLNYMYSGYVGETESEVVNSMLTRGGFTSMLSTIALLMAAGIFGAPLRTAGVVDVLLDFVKKVAKSSKSMSLGVLLLHGIFFTITGAYYVSYPVVGEMVKDLYPEYGLDKKNLMRTMLDTGTGLAPLVPWSTTGSYTATTLGISNMAFAPFAPMLWLSIVFSIIMSVTGLFVVKLKADK